MRVATTARPRPTRCWPGWRSKTATSGTSFRRSSRRSWIPQRSVAVLYEMVVARVMTPLFRRPPRDHIIGAFLVVLGLRLPRRRRVPLEVSCRIREATADPHLLQYTLAADRATGGDEPAQRERPDVAPGRRPFAVEESTPSAVIDVLIVKKDDDALHLASSRGGCKKKPETARPFANDLSAVRIPPRRGPLQTEAWRMAARVLPGADFAARPRCGRLLRGGVTLLTPTDPRGHRMRSSKWGAQDGPDIQHLLR